MLKRALFGRKLPRMIVRDSGCDGTHPTPSVVWRIRLVNGSFAGCRRVARDGYARRTVRRHRAEDRPLRHGGGGRRTVSGTGPERDQPAIQELYDVAR